MAVRIHTSLEELPAEAWDRLGGDRDPFVSHAFLAALERHDCLEPFGWYPRHVTVHDASGALRGAVPFYLKDNSYGEFVFDWEWAEAYQRAGLDYYPKGVVGVPYTPATGPRLLLANRDDDATAQQLIEAVHALADELDLSSVHWNFLEEDDSRRLEAAGLLQRTGWQYHWEHRGETNFEALLMGFTRDKRKKIRQERRRAAASGLRFETVHGDAASASDWTTFHALYLHLFERKWGMPTLSREFFAEIGARLGRRVVLQLARDASGSIVAAALLLRGEHTLYGRHWGCRETVDGLHFELCYYRGLEYCLEHGLRRFEPGAQGEYKIARGFLPTLTRSAHRITDSRFRQALDGHLARERRAVQHQVEMLTEHTPYRT